MNNILEVTGLSKHYDTFLLDEVSFALGKGYIMGFIGPNGSGKTTTIKSILGITTPDDGRIELFGVSDDLTQNKRIGVVMDTPLYVEDWSAGDVGAALMPFYDNWDKVQFKTYLDKFGIDPKKQVKELSRGMRVKLQIAVALSHEAELLILDEPTSGLDPIARDEICDLLREFVIDENKSVFFSTHITSDLEKVADYITFIMNGKIIYSGTRDEILESYVHVAGGLSDLSLEQKRLIIGYREHGTGFEGMLDVGCISSMPKGVLIEEVNLDEIIIFMNERGKDHD